MEVPASPVATQSMGGADGPTPSGLFDGLFRELPPPLLQAPAAPISEAPAPRTRKARREIASTRSSTRLAAKSSAVPVAHRTQQRLMRELSFIDNTQPREEDMTVTEYLDLYTKDLPEQAVRAIQIAANLGNKKLCKILVAVMQETEVLEAEA